ncbi:mitochondrial thiamine pyrophosphate transporter [Coemansia sp. RSA 1813]|nr:mitochondrial thiamine pyrophosphate transporter [Coemansia sp. RSA 1646]KAJ1771747.1 mitochondrial thiamine pyrophosphate transporter [Coemansia sp. RSA 1843]KAJ2091688.1 mitochondrial thiamine pyrophosphate transporter [Coemansia sp. RSA 986]KAJ2216910.1 mitochondrial thiamine pyrophosphate transporter [Coemansia sp. RSA 487]KAJ2571913.1 mitochondrial thiamine pyrophosphate transporter [Coemansia sp. RSA 1813]
MSLPPTLSPPENTSTNGTSRLISLAAPLAMPTDKQTAPRDNVLMRTSRSGAVRSLSTGENILCGATAGLVSRAIVSPFDVVKITLQLETQKRTAGVLRSDGVIHCAAKILRNEGVRGLFKGNLSAEYLYLTYGATQFLAFGALESAFRKIDAVPQKTRSFVCGALAGGIATSVTYPLDLLRTRFIAQESTNRIHASIVGAIAQIYRDEGPRGFYRGLWPACLQIMPYMGIVFTSYDTLASGYMWMRRNVVASNGPVVRTIDSVQDALIGASAAVIGKCCVYPLDLVRKRLQIQGPRLQNYAHGAVPRYTGLSNALLFIVRNEGFLSLFRGLTPSLIKAAPASATVFFVYGQTRDLILSHGSK